MLMIDDVDVDAVYFGGFGGIYTSSIHKDKSCRVGTEEKLIKFRPSPKFKNMKKFLKSKIDSSENSNYSPLSGVEHSPTNTSPEPVTSREEQRALLEKAKPTQQPLPLEPPPTTPTDFSLPHKQVFVDHEYQSRLPSPTLNLHDNSEVGLRNYEMPRVEASEEPEKTMCRNFIRGTCTRPACRFAHELIKSQLPDVYTFCRNFQNTSCTYPYCKYVHASVSGEQRFLETGILPPDALAHHKKPPLVAAPTMAPTLAPTLTPVPALMPVPVSTMLLPLPPTPEEPAPASNHVDVTVFANPPPVLVERPVNTCVPTGNQQWRSRPNNHFLITPAPRDIDHKAKKCNYCADMELRLQFNKDKAENMRQSTVELKNEVAHLSRKSHTLYTALWQLLN